MLSAFVSCYLLSLLERELDDRVVEPSDGSPVLIGQSARERSPFAVQRLLREV
jgi:hypothetical protein